MKQDRKNSILYDELAEKYILSTYISGKRLFVEDSGLIPKTEWFFETAHKEIFKSIEALETKGIEVDILSVTKNLRERKKLNQIGGDGYLLTILEDSPIQSRVENALKTLRDFYLRREVMKIAKETTQHALDEAKTISEVFNDFTEKVINTESIRFPTTIIDLQDNLDDVVGKVYEPKEKERIVCDYDNLNKILGGFRRNNLIILASRPGEGKTTLALNIAFQVACSSLLPTVFFSLEMDRFQLLKRLLASEGTTTGTSFDFKKEDPNWDQIHQKSIEAYPINTAGELTLHAIEEAEEDFPEKRTIFNTKELREKERERIATLITHNRFSDVDHKLHVSDKPSMTVSDMKIQCRRLAREKGPLGMVVIDYLQLLRSGQKYFNRYDEITSISRSLKILAKDLNCPVIAISQLSRGIDSRPGTKVPLKSGGDYEIDPRPRLSDLRESGSIEQDADSVVFIYDQYRNRSKKEKENAQKRHSLNKGEWPISLNIEKNRHGRTGKIEMIFTKASQHMREKDWSEERI